MIPASALLVLSALLHASWNALVKRARDRESAPLAIVLVCAIVSLAWALATERGPLPSASAIGWTVAAGVFEGGYLVALGRAMRDAPIGVAYAVSRGGAMLVVWPVSLVVLGEHATVRSLLGAAILGAGLAVASVTPETLAGLRGPPRAAAGAPVRLGWSWATALCIAGYHLAYGRALAAGIHAAPAVAASVAIGVGTAHAIRPAGQRGAALRALRQQPWLAAVGGVLSATSFLVFLEGLARSGAGTAISLRNTSIAFTIVLSALLGERATARQWAGSAVVAAGALLVGG